MARSQIVVVFNASSRQGLAQLRQLLTVGHRPRAVTRQAKLLSHFNGIEVVSADFTDAASLDAAMAGADAVFFQPPLLDHPDRLRSHARNVAQAAKRAGIARFIHNSTMWSPESAEYPCGQYTYDLMREMEESSTASGVPLVVFRPTLFMDNWLSAFAKPLLLGQHLYRYPHKPSMRFSPISLDDLAKFMVAALDRDDLFGRRLRVSGPEILVPEDVRAALSDAIGTHIRYEYQTPADFAAFTFDGFIHKTGADRAAYIAGFDDFYTFNNESPLKPFEFDVQPVLDLIPIQLETFRNWARRQDWTSQEESVGSVSG